MDPNKKEVREELEQLSSRLARLKEQQKQPFDLPHNYFRELPEEVMARIRSEESPSGWWPELSARIAALWRLRYAALLATVAVLAAVGFWQLNRPAESELRAEDIFASITAEEADAYIRSNIDDFANELVLEVSQTPSAKSPSASSLEEHEIEEYLNDALEDLDPEELEDLL